MPISFKSVTSRECNALGRWRDAGSRDQKGAGLNSQSLRDEICFRAGLAGNGKVTKNAEGQPWIWREECIERGNQSLRRVQTGAHLRGFDRCILSGLLIYADFDRSFTARGITEFERGLAIRIRAVIAGRVAVATTVVVYDRLHHRAGKYRLCLQWPDGQYEQEQGPQE